MKNSLFYTDYYWLNLLTPLVLLMPILAILLNPGVRKKSIIPLALMFAIFMAISLLNADLLGYFPSLKNWLVIGGFMLMAPLTLLSLEFFRAGSSFGLRFQKSLRVTLLMFLLAGAGILVRQGLDEISGFMIVGTGVLLVLLFYLPVFYRQIRTTIQKRSETGKAFMIAAVVFAFGSYFLVFLMNIWLQNKVRLSDSFLLFHLIIILFSLLFTTGCLLYKVPASNPAPARQKSKIPLLTEWEDL